MTRRYGSVAAGRDRRCWVLDDDTAVVNSMADLLRAEKVSSLRHAPIGGISDPANVRLDAVSPTS